MPSARYTLNIDPEDLKPDTPPEYTPKQKRQNWWQYNKKWVAIGLVVLVIVAIGIRDMTQRVQPDYKVLYVSPTYLLDAVNQQLTEGIAAMGQDLNGDGQVKVEIITCQVNFYDQDGDEITETGEKATVTEDDWNPNAANDAYAHMAGVTRLMAELDARDSLIVLTDRPQDVIGSYEMLQDGTLYRWADCPTLTGLSAGISYADLDGQQHAADAIFQNMYIACRNFDPAHPMQEYAQQNQALFDALVQGASPAQLATQ